MHTLVFFDIKSFQLAKEDVDDIELAILPAPCQACQDDSFESMDFVARAFQQAREMAEIALGKKMKEVEKKEKDSKKPRRGPKNGSLSCCEGKPWWKVYDKSLEHSPLEMWWVTDEKKKIKMDGKNFASRCYHRVDAVSRSLAKSAHQDALKFAALKIGTVEPSSKRSKTKKGLKQ